MIIDRISILNFKNIAEAELAFSPKMNYLFGNNGMGKTNLLDALYYLSFTKSNTNLTDTQLTRHNEEYCMLHGYYSNGEDLEDIYCGIKRKHKKVFKRNNKEYSRLSEHIGLLPLVMVSPDDIELIRGGSEQRRKFVDMIISQYDKEYLRNLIFYNRALVQRNSLLKEATAFSDDSLFEILEEQMIETGELINLKRKEFLVSFLPIFKEYYEKVSRGEENVELKYDSQLNELSLFELFASKREKDKIVGYTSVGIHKDDFDFLLDDYLIRKIGSQGQNKTYLIALKLAQFSFLEQKGSTTPILLLDDIFDKLDANRVEQIIDLVGGSQFGQIFITDTNRNYLDEILSSKTYDYKLFRVSNGTINEEA